MIKINLNQSLKKRIRMVVNEKEERMIVKFNVEI